MLKIQQLFFLAIAAFCFSTFVQHAHAQELYDDFQGNWKAQVLEVLDEKEENLFGADYTIQTIQAEIVTGPEEGRVLEIINDFQPLNAGDSFYFNHYVYINGSESYTVTGVARQGSLIFLTLVFIAAVIVFGKWQGVRSLIALAASFLAIIFILIPGILSGWDPLIASVIVAGTILFAAIFFTHGFNRESTVAYGGTMLAVFITSLFALFSVYITKLSGFAGDESVYLNFNTGGALNFTSLLLGAFIIGFLGVLDDIAVTQAAVVTELYGSNPKISKREVYLRAMRIGREHVGALVNTLVLAYTGASLPLLLYFYSASATVAGTVNLEIFATEIVRIIVGSMGLILTVPIVTLLAVHYLKGYKPKNHHTHSHAHGHTHSHTD